MDKRLRQGSARRGRVTDTLHGCKTVTVGNPTGYGNEERRPEFRPDRVIEVPEGAHGATVKVARAEAAHDPLDAAVTGIAPSST